MLENGYNDTYTGMYNVHIVIPSRAINREATQ
jgi:hypothetical protein